MKGAIRAGILAGIVSALVLAGIDWNFLVFEVGGFWLRLGPALASLIIYLLLGAVFGGLAGWIWTRLRGAASGSIPLLRGMVISFTFASLAVFCWLYLYDFGLGQSERGRTWHYLTALPLSLMVSLCTWWVFKLLLSLLGRTKNRMAWAAVALAAIVSIEVLLVRFVWPGTSRAVDGSTAAGAPNMVLLVMDTTRLDALSGYGNPRRTTPYLDRIASEGLVFTRAYAPASWTPPSHASMFTGLYPSEHGTFSKQVLLKRGYATVAEILSEAGYETFFLSYKGVLRKSHGWNRGFDHSVTVNVEDKASLLYERVFEKLLKKDVSPTPLTVDIALEWLQSRAPSRPFFLFLNVSDPHAGYVPREPFFSECCSVIDLSQVDVKKVHELVKNQYSLGMYNRGEIQLNASELDYVRCLYDSEADYMDRYIGRLFDQLGQLQDGRRTVAVITSDHGEMLGEHDLMSHGKYLYDELIRVPLTVWGTGETGVIDDLVSLVDLLPTFLELAGIPMQDRPAQGGTSLLVPRENRILFAESWSTGVFRKALIGVEFKYMWESTGGQYLFDLIEDPGELQNLAQATPELAQALHGELASRFDLSLDGVEADEIDREMLKILKSLGYVH